MKVEVLSVIQGVRLIAETESEAILLKHLQEPNMSYFWAQGNANWSSMLMTPRSAELKLGEELK